ncbi:LytTR family DNA-binding domain-containing protein [Pedobacter sp. KR3-3]|uniref:LytTR family DNA-binding domain-containing protein n=1 Tax=Pedobacter albus TaxID=3113905 RepID=A0ABU7I7Z9_9SPHI|nr:LytTR family DNA-binding domain-containing protein [Pedobacter sp. KR3-3]MEE1945354.1 LytTR family DNA-binding domain-containing protein [Pedobacter sp. KR3-3]
MLNLGTPEIILILVASIFFALLFGGVVFFIVYLARRTGTQKIPVVVYPDQVGFKDFRQVPSTVAPKSADAPKDTSALATELKIALPQQSEIRYVKISDIIRCEADDNYTNFVLTTEKILISKSLKEYADLLKPYGFLRVHQSHLVNPAYVKSWLKEDGGTLLLDNGHKIPVSKPNRESIKLALGK